MDKRTDAAVTGASSALRRIGNRWRIQRSLSPPLYGALSLWRLVARDTVVGAGDRHRTRAGMGQRLRMDDVRHIVPEADRRRAEGGNDDIATVHGAIWKVAGGVGRRANTIEHPGDTACRRHGAGAIATGWTDQLVGRVRNRRAIWRRCELGWLRHGRRVRRRCPAIRLARIEAVRALQTRLWRHVDAHVVLIGGESVGRAGRAVVKGDRQPVRRAPTVVEGHIVGLRHLHVLGGLRDADVRLVECIAVHTRRRIHRPTRPRLHQQVFDVFVGDIDLHIARAHVRKDLLGQRDELAGGELLDLLLDQPHHQLREPLANVVDMWVVRVQLFLLGDARGILLIVVDARLKVIGGDRLVVAGNEDRTSDEQGMADRDRRNLNYAIHIGDAAIAAFVVEDLHVELGGRRIVGAEVRVTQIPSYRTATRYRARGAFCRKYPAVAVIVELVDVLQFERFETAIGNGQHTIVAGEAAAGS